MKNKLTFISFSWGFSHNSVALELDIWKIEVIIWVLLQDGLPQIIFVPLKSQLCKKQWMYILGPGDLLPGILRKMWWGTWARASSVELLFVSGAASLSYPGCKFPGDCPCSSGLDLHFIELCPKWQTTSEVLQPLIEFPCSWSPSCTPLHLTSTPSSWGQPVLLRETHFFKDMRLCSSIFSPLISF